MTHRSKVRPPVRSLTEAEARAALSGGILRIANEHGPSRVGLEIGCDEKTVRNARDQKSTLRIDLAFNLLKLDPNALDELAGQYGFRLVPVKASAANDLSTAAGLMEGATEIIHALEDNFRSPSETCRIADKLRPHLPAAIAIIDEADAIKARN